MPRKKTHEEFIQELNNIDPSLEVLGQYINNRTQICVRCKACGKEWITTPHSLLSGKGCRECKLMALANRRRKTHEQFIIELMGINSNIKILNCYQGSHKMIRAECDICGYIWDSTPHDLLSGYGCKQCGITRRATSKKIAPSTFQQRVQLINPEILFLSEYKGAVKPIKVACSKCNHVWEPKAESLLQGKGCPNCAIKKNAEKSRKTHQEYISELQERHPDIEVIGQYTGDNHVLEVKCNVCNYIWKPRAGDLLRVQGCKRCSRSGTSYIEQFILGAFEQALGKKAVLSRDRVSIGMELDIYIPSLKFAIEPGSWVFHRFSVNRDIEKQNKCKEKGIKLVTVYYDYPKQFVPPPLDNCILYRSDSADSMHNLVAKLFSLASIEYSFTNDQWAMLSNNAIEYSKAKNTVTFRNELSMINPEIEILGVYQGSKIPIQVLCKKCNQEWSARPNNLLNGQGCPNCAAKRIAQKQYKPQQIFLEEMKRLQPNISVLGEYKKSKEPILVQCNVCGHKWEPIPNSLLSGEGCPICGLKKKVTSRMMTKLQYESELHQLNPNIIIIGNYSGVTKSIHVKCTICGFEWTTVAKKLLHNPFHVNIDLLHKDL